MKKNVMMALLLGTALLAVGCSGKKEDTKGTTEAEVSTEADTKTEAADEEETAEEESEEAALLETEEETESVSEEISEEAKEATEEELGERPEYDALDYVTLGTYKGLSVTLDPITVSDEEVDQDIRDEIEYADLYDQRTDGTVAEGDIANIDYEGKLNGEAFAGGTDQGYDLTIGSHSFIDGFEDGLIGVAVGDTVDLTLTFPEDYPSEDLAGQETVFTVTVNYIKTAPEITNDLISQLTNGAYSSVESYREHVADELQASKEQEQENSVYTELMTQLYNTCTVNDYPQELVDYSVQSMVKTYKDYAEMYGMEYADFLSSYLGMEEEQFLQEAEASVKQNLEIELILKGIAEQEELTISDEEYKAGLERYAQQYGYETGEQLEAEAGQAILELDFLLDKTLDFVKENAIVEVLEPETETDAIDAAVDENAEDDEEAVSEGIEEEAETESEIVAEAVAEAETESESETE